VHHETSAVINAGSQSLIDAGAKGSKVCPLELHLTTSELWFGQEQEGILPELLSSSVIV